MLVRRKDVILMVSCSPPAEQKQKVKKPSMPVLFAVILHMNLTKCIKIIMIKRLGLVTDTHYTSYSKVGDWKDPGSRPVWAKT
jgi:hypothetical protein